ncbi:MAG: hypothetical protein OEY79_02845 [Anaplasmataceae bacterium]|nr:hypothetical protein [Anaplasmataceae bacterium]
MFDFGGYQSGWSATSSVSSFDTSGVWDTTPSWSSSSSLNGSFSSSSLSSSSSFNDYLSTPSYITNSSFDDSINYFPSLSGDMGGNFSSNNAFDNNIHQVNLMPLVIDSGILLDSSNIVPSTIVPEIKVIDITSTNDTKLEINNPSLIGKAELNVASNNLSNNLSPKVDIKDVEIKDNKLLEVHAPGENVVNIHNDFHSPCKEDETTCIGYDSKDRPNKIICKKGDADC